MATTIRIDEVVVTAFLAGEVRVDLDELLCQRPGEDGDPPRHPIRCFTPADVGALGAVGLVPIEDEAAAGQAGRRYCPGAGASSLR